MLALAQRLVFLGSFLSALALGKCVDEFIALGIPLEYYREAMRVIAADNPGAKIRHLATGGMSLVFRIEKEGQEPRVAKLLRDPKNNRAKADYHNAWELNMALPPEHFLLPTRLTDKDGITVAYYPLAEAQTLLDYIPELGSQVAPTVLLDLFQEVAVPVHVLHQKGFAHNDLKPANIFPKSKDGFLNGAKLGDLDTVRKEGAEIASGVATPFYFQKRNLSEDQWRKVLYTSSKQRDLDAIQKIFQDIALGPVTPTFETWELGGNPVKTMTGSIRDHDPKADRVVSAVTSLSFPDTKALLSIVGKAKKAHGEKDPWKAFLPELEEYLVETLNTETATAVLLRNKDIRDAYSSGMLKLPERILHFYELHRRAGS